MMKVWLLNTKHTQYVKTCSVQNYIYIRSSTLFPEYIFVRSTKKNGWIKNIDQYKLKMVVRSE